MLLQRPDDPAPMTVPVGADGKVQIANLGWGSAHVIVDLFGHFG
ncbi:hypothetical protein [Streptomyces sp. NPDC101206]